jgi:hypothetical protein
VTTTFGLSVQHWVEKAKGREDLAVRKIAMEIFRRVVMRSPVDTGRFRGNWQAEINAPAAGQLAATDKGGGATLAKIQAVVEQATVGMHIFLANNLPYARRLEYGWSKQAPAGMVRITVQEFQTIVDQAVQQTKAELP